MAIPAFTLNWFNDQPRYRSFALPFFDHVFSYFKTKILQRYGGDDLQGLQIYSIITKLFGRNGGNFLKWGAQVHFKKLRKIFVFKMATVTSQPLKYDAINFCQHV